MNFNNLKDLLFTAVFLLTVILFVVDHLIATADPETPTDCAEEDTPVHLTAVNTKVKTSGHAVTYSYWIDQDGQIHTGKVQ